MAAWVRSSTPNFYEHVFKMLFDRVHGDAELRRDLLVAETADDESDHVALARGELRAPEPSGQTPCVFLVEGETKASRRSCCPG